MNYNSNAVPYGITIRFVRVLAPDDLPFLFDVCRCIRIETKLRSDGTATRTFLKAHMRGHRKVANIVCVKVKRKQYEYYDRRTSTKFLTRRSSCFQKTSGHCGLKGIF